MELPFSDDDDDEYSSPKPVPSHLLAPHFKGLLATLQDHFKAQKLDLDISLLDKVWLPGNLRNSECFNFSWIIPTSMARGSSHLITGCFDTPGPLSRLNETDALQIELILRQDELRAVVHQNAVMNDPLLSDSLEIPEGWSQWLSGDELRDLEYEEQMAAEDALLGGWMSDSEEEQEVQGSSIARPRLYTEWRLIGGLSLEDVMGPWKREGSLGSIHGYRYDPERNKYFRVRTTAMEGMPPAISLSRDHIPVCRGMPSLKRPLPETADTVQQNPKRQAAEVIQSRAIPPIELAPQKVNAPLRSVHHVDCYDMVRSVTKYLDNNMVSKTTTIKKLRQLTYNLFNFNEKEYPFKDMQLWTLKDLGDSFFIGDLRFVDFRDLEGYNGVRSSDEVNELIWLDKECVDHDQLVSQVLDISKGSTCWDFIVRFPEYSISSEFLSNLQYHAPSSLGVQHGRSDDFKEVMLDAMALPLERQLNYFRGFDKHNIPIFTFIHPVGSPAMTAREFISLCEGVTSRPYLKAAYPENANPQTGRHDPEGSNLDDFRCFRINLAEGLSKIDPQVDKLQNDPSGKLFNADEMLASRMLQQLIRIHGKQPQVQDIAADQKYMEPYMSSMYRVFHQLNRTKNPIASEDDEVDSDWGGNFIIVEGLEELGKHTDSTELGSKYILKLMRALGGIAARRQLAIVCVVGQDTPAVRYALEEYQRSCALRMVHLCLTN
ncbi:hypothetical protein BJ508DRAFT_157241 [Ascobolus immersus RN42]|uniref:Uncharacterized protein n=1 Tax=Ascobolus immersus RN42 TaxID=1160509 RepID=A0A3N4HWS3_ASCIM|nr:hypothetical protein BJ508DRAFT_157241 [Ascobolus immersus RN42]